MRKRKKEKGFTLIEILVAIVILGIVSVIAIASVQSVMKNGRVKYYKSLNEMIVSAAKEYFSDNKSKLPVEVDDSNFVTLETLEKEDYIDKVQDADGKNCSDAKNAKATNRVTVIKTANNKYEYTLDLVCPDDKMPEVTSGVYEKENGNITFEDLNPSSSSSKTIKMCIVGDRKDYSYELIKEGKIVRTKKGTLNDGGENCINIKLDEGNGCYQITGRTGNGLSSTSSQYCIEVPTPSCEGLRYSVNRVAKQWFKGDLEVEVGLKDNILSAEAKKATKEYEDKYFIENYKVCYGNSSSCKSSTSAKTGSGTQKFVFSNKTEKSELYIMIGNSSTKKSGDVKCSLGEYYSDNTPPLCKNQTVNNTWTNNRQFYVTTDCDDRDESRGEASVNQSGCREKQYRDDTEGEYANIVIEDKVGNQQTCTFLKKKDITAPKCTTSNYGSQWYSNAVNSSKRVAWATCDDPKDAQGKKLSGCTKSRLENDTEGATQSFTFSDNAGNRTDCTAQKYIDNTKPTCGTSSKYNGRWSPSNTAWVNCNDQSNLSGCTQSRFQNTPTDGRLESKIVVRDRAGNTQNCNNIEKYRDTVAPQCNNYQAKQSKTVKGTSSYRDALGNLIQNEYIDHFEVGATASCSDPVNSGNNSGCKQTSYSIQNNYAQTSEPPAITVEDNAGNKTACPKSNQKVISKVSCPTRQFSGTSAGLWTNSSQYLTLSFNKNVRISGLDYRVSRVFNSTYGSTFSLNYNTEGIYPASKYTACADDGTCVNCQLPSIRIDKTAPYISPSQYRYDTINWKALGYVRDDRCGTYVGSLKFHEFGRSDFPTFRINYNTYITDNLSGIGKRVYHYAPQFYVKERGTDAPVWTMYVPEATGSSRTHVEERGGYFNTASQGSLASSFSETFNTRMSSSVYSANGLYSKDVDGCYYYCAAFNVYDYAGNLNAFGSYGIGGGCGYNSSYDEDDNLKYLSTNG